MKSRPALVVLGAVCGLTVALSAAGCSALSTQGLQSAGQPKAEASDTLAPTQWGPMSSADKELLTLVRQTSIREITTSQWALKWSASPLVKQAAQMIMTQHVQLQNQDISVANTLGVALPDQPRADMIAGMDRLKTERGKIFDLDYTNMLRQAHGAALILISTVRADTQNSLVRNFADTAHDFIQNHIQMLEKTGEVDYSMLPIPAES